MCQTIVILAAQTTAAKEVGDMKLYEANINEIKEYCANLASSTTKTLVPSKKGLEGDNNISFLFYFISRFFNYL
jgi:hypothetical protein